MEQRRIENRGYFGIGIEHTKTEYNVGTLWRSAFSFGASFVFTIGRRYKKQSSDTTISWRHIPLYHYGSFEEFYRSLPYDCILVGVEIAEKSILIEKFVHPERCVYLLGAEDAGLSKRALDECWRIIQLPGRYCLNVATTGSIVMYDRITKEGK